MEVLDRVYITFKNLDRDFARSKKTRTEFIKDKFGGDIQIGSMIILEAISSSTGNESPEDIEKLTFIKDTFDGIKSVQDKLDTLPSFSAFQDAGAFNDLIEVLELADFCGTKVKCVKQSELCKAEKGVAHFIANKDTSMYADLNACNILHSYNDHIARLIFNVVNVEGDISESPYFEMKSKSHAVVVNEKKALRLLRKD